MAHEVKLKDVRLSFPDLFTAKDYQGNGKFRYSATFLIVPGSENDKLIQAAILAAAKEEYGKDAGQIEAWRGNPQKFCYTPGSLKKYDGYEGMMALSTHRYATQGRVGVYNRDLTPLTEADGKPYGGCYVNARVEIWAQGGKNAGIRGGLVSVQFVRDGDAFSGATKPSADDFELIEEGANAEDIA